MSYAGPQEDAAKEEREKRMSKRVVVTGSAGFVGTHTTRYLLEKTDWTIIGFDSFRHKGDSLRVQKHERLNTISLDLTAPISERLINTLGPIDYVINCASMSHVDTSISDPVPFWENNTKLIANILEFARKTNVKTFIHCSTDEVFGAAPDGYAHHEWDVILPSNPYAASKAAQEALCIAYWRTYGLPVIITNTMNMVGTMQDPEKFLPMLIGKIHREEEVTIHGSPGRIGSRMYLDCRNLADAWLFLLKNHEPVKYSDENGDHQRPSRFNIAGLEEINNLELARRVRALMKAPGLQYRLVDFHATRPGHDRRYALSSQKIRDLGWTPPFSLDDTLRWVIDWTLQNPSWL